MKFPGVTVSLSSGYHPQSNGQSERKIQEISLFLRTYCHTNQHSWSRFLSWAEYAQNSLKQASMGLTSIQCMLGYQPPVSLVRGTITSSGCGRLVQREQQGLKRNTYSAQQGSSATEEPGRQQNIRSTSVPPRTKGLALN